MEKPFRSNFLLAAFARLPLSIVTLIAGAEPVAAAQGGSLHLIKREDFPSVQLRGYGWVSGSLLASPDAKPVSLLAIHCESDTKAGILQAKYLSDFGLLPGVTSVTIQTKRGTITGRQVDGQGDVAALRSGADGPTIAVSLDTFETQAVLTPRNEIASAPADWFELQRNWWRGSGAPGPIIPPFKSKSTLDPQSGWSFKILDGPSDGTQGAALSATSVDDSSWEKRPFGVFTFPDHHDARHALFRKRFTVPVDWNGGKISLWLSEWHGYSYIDNGQVYLDGTALSSHALTGDDLNGSLEPGTAHTLAVEIWGENPVVGTPASIWLDYRPDALQEEDLAGNWTPAADGPTYTHPVAIPGSNTGITLRQTVKIDTAHREQTAVLRVSANDTSIYGVIVNGMRVPRFHHHVGNDFDLAITPFVKFGQDDEILLFGSAGPPPLNRVSLDYYTRGTYP
jgi:hypothetical protein